MRYIQLVNFELQEYKRNSYRLCNSSKDYQKWELDASLVRRPEEHLISYHSIKDSQVGTLKLSALPLKWLPWIDNNQNSWFIFCSSLVILNFKNSRTAESNRAFSVMELLLYSRIHVFRSNCTTEALHFSCVHELFALRITYSAFPLIHCKMNGHEYKLLAHKSMTSGTL